MQLPLRIPATFLRFLVVGVANTFAALGLIFIAKAWLGLGDATANALGYALGLSLSFTLNRRWTFRHGGALGRSVPAFLLVQALAYGLNLLCVLALIDWGMNAYLAQTLGIPPYTLASYLGSRYLVFAEPAAPG
jgi:putative flippase GtrA